MSLEVVKNERIPIKGIPEDLFNTLVMGPGGLIDWLIKILSVKNTPDNVERLKTLVPVIKESCWSLTFEDIKKAFTMYVNGQLPVAPKDNYLTVILFAQVIGHYKDQRRPKPKQWEPPQLSDQEKADLIYTGCVNCYGMWVQDKEVSPGYAWVYDHLDELGLLNFTPAEKKEALQSVKKSETASVIGRIEDSKDKRIAKAKRILLAKYFEQTTKEEFKKNIG